MLVEITYACKMNCSHCMSDCKPDGENMTLEVLEDTLKFMRRNRIPTWTFSGGEMFEHPQILDALKLISKKIADDVQSDGIQLYLFSSLLER